MKKWIPVAILVLLWVIIFYKTYVGGTYLLGWDNLVPELGFGINISRALSTAWQEYQGVGLLGGMGHAADLTRQILLWIASLVVPMGFLRWGWTLLMLLVGSLGVYSLGVFLFSSGLPATVGAVFYLLNPVTIQVLNVPFETFTSFYGFVPWMIYSVLKYLKDGKRVDLTKLLVILLLGMSAFVVQTMFVVFVIMLAVLSLEYLIKHRDLKRLIKLWGVVAGVTMFWLLPVLWFGVTSSSVNVNAKMNLLATYEVELMNVAYGSLSDVAQLDGWWLQNTDVSKDGSMILLMKNWTDWLGNNTVGVVGTVIFVLALLGLLVMFRKDQKGNLKWGWIALLLLILIMLARRVEVFATIYDYIAQNVPLFGQLFRASYTKWSMPLILVMSLGIMSFTGFFGKWLKNIGWLVGVMIAGMATYTVLPVFDVGIVGERIRVSLPIEYLDLFKYFKVVEKGRIVILPANSLWGWQYNGWGYRGSGFLWYGIEQPILDRAFDVWSPYNEGFYQELSTALYAVGADPQTRKPEQYGKVASVLEKYDVKYVLLDESIIAPGQDEEILRIKETKQMAQELGWREVWQEGFLTAWETPHGEGEKFVSVPESYVLAEGDTLKTRRDVIWEENDTYISGLGGAKYPFADLMREEVNGLEREVEGGELVVPGWEAGKRVVANYQLLLHDGVLELKWEPTYTINELAGPKLPDQAYDLNEPWAWVKVGTGNEGAIYLEEGTTKRGQVELVVGEDIKIAIYQGEVGSSDKLADNWVEDKVQTCWEKEGGPAFAKASAGEEGELKLEVQNAAACLPLPLATSKEQELIQAVLFHRSESGMRPEMCLDTAEAPYECENELIWEKEPASNDWQYVVRTVESPRGEQYWLNVSAKPIEPASKERAIEYQLPVVNRYPLIGESTIEAGWGEYLVEKEMRIEGNRIVVEIPGEARYFDLAQFGREEALNCDALARGGVEKEGGKYWADQYGANCDYLELAGIEPQLSYLMRMRGENLEGRSVKVFLHNTGTGRNDLEYLLSKGQFDQTFALLPWEVTGKYSLNVETRSFGRYAENVVGPVEVRYLPLEQLARARVGEVERVENSLRVKSVKKTGTWLYQVTVEGKGLLTLSQGYDDGWIAWDRGGSNKLLEHVKVNGWKNGWVVNQEIGTKEMSEKSIVTMYWPQLLEYLGFVILGVTILWLVRKK